LVFSLLALRSVSLFFFFFQAEDGIRDFHVTGVQTCALPIFVGGYLRQPVRCFGGCPSPGSLPDRLRGDSIRNVVVRIVVSLLGRSEERRVGKECRCRWEQDDWERSEGVKLANEVGGCSTRCQ